MHHTQDTTKTGSEPAPDTASLPLRKDAPELPACDPPQKDIHKTTGGKITDFLIYDALGFGVNSAVSIGVTYGINPRPSVKKAKESITKAAQKIFKDVVPAGSVGNMAEISFMLITGTAITAAMTPLVKRRDRIAYWINKKLGKDTDVLPEHMRTYNTPLTVEDKIEQELKKRVNYGQTAGDLWKARWSSIWVPLLGDGLLGKWSSMREAKGKPSVDTLSWKAGMHLYDNVLPQSTIHKLGDFFKNRKAGIEDIRENNPEIYGRLSRIEQKHDEFNQKMRGMGAATESVRNDRMMIADQTRLLGKEVGWTFINAKIVEKLTCSFQARRIRKQESKVLATMQQEGIIPTGVLAAVDKDGHIKLTTTDAYVAPERNREILPEDATRQTGRVAKKAKPPLSDMPSGHVNALDKSRAAASNQQTSLT